MTVTVSAKYALLTSLCLVLAVAFLPLGALCQTPCPTSPVPDGPPDSIDVALYDALFADTNYISLLPERSDRQPRNVVLVIFDSTATHEQRQSAIQAACEGCLGEPFPTTTSRSRRTGLPQVFGGP